MTNFNSFSSILTGLKLTLYFLPTVSAAPHLNIYKNLDKNICKKLDAQGNDCFAKYLKEGLLLPYNLTGFSFCTGCSMYLSPPLATSTSAPVSSSSVANSASGRLGKNYEDENTQNKKRRVA